MHPRPTIQQFLAKHFSPLPENISCIDDSQTIDIQKIQLGILIVLALWSGPARGNVLHILHSLAKLNYAGQILLIDHDCMSPQFQVALLGRGCEGWGEIFVIRNGGIVEHYFGRACARDFLQALNKDLA